MKREIKFRAWDKYTECYLYGIQDAYDMLSGHVKYDDGEDADYDADCFGNFLDNNRYVVEQFTGLKDKNGRSIYEDDVVRWGDMVGFCHEKPVRVAVVRFDPDICFDSNVGIFDYGNFAYEETDKYLTVIGNIHENPELLEAYK